MPHISWVEETKASGDLLKIFQAWRTENPTRKKFPDILSCFTLRPDFLRQVMDVSNSLHFADGHLDRRTKEMIATLVSGLNQCPY